MRDPAAEVDHWISIYSVNWKFKLLGRASRTVAGLTGEEMAYYSYPIVGPDVGVGKAYLRLYLYRLAFFNRGDVQYRVAWATPAEVAQCFWDDFDHILDTFKFLD